MGKFETCVQRGVHFTFDNGVTASIQWGAGNYCDNHIDFSLGYGSHYSSSTAEVAAIDSAGRFITSSVCEGWERFDPSDDVIGYLTPDEVVEFMTLCKNFGVQKDV